MNMYKQKAKLEHLANLDRLNSQVGKYQSVNMKVDWALEDPVLYEIA